MAKTKKDYRALKKELNKYHKFSFNMPRAGKEFTPQQKSAITRQLKKLKGVIDNERTTFIRYQKGKKYSGVSALRTNKGIIIAAPKAKIKKEAKTSKYFVEVPSGPYLFKEYTFPNRLLLRPDNIDAWVKEKITKLGEHYDGAMWLRLGTRNTSRYESGIINLYLSADSSSTDNAKIGSIVGVSLVYRKLGRKYGQKTKENSGN